MRDICSCGTLIDTEFDGCQCLECREEAEFKELFKECAELTEANTRIEMGLRELEEFMKGDIQ